MDAIKGSAVARHSTFPIAIDEAPLLRRQYRAAALSGVPIAITQGSDHVIHYTNEAFCNALGQVPAALDRARFVEICREPSILQALLDRCYRLRTIGLAENVSYLRRTHSMFATTLVAPLTDDDEGLVVHVIDTTEQMRTATREARADGDLREANQRLLLAALREQRLAERANRLYREAQDAIRMRDDVLAVVSHDLQSPLNAIGMTVRRLLSRPELADTGAQRPLNLIRRTSEYMEHLIAELLDFARIHAGQLQLQRARVDIAELIEEASLVLEPEAERKAIRIEQRISMAPLVASGDAERTMRVLLNLIGNAIKYSPEGGQILISAEACGQEIQVGVHDRGPGIARGDMAKLFEPYWKGERAGRDGMGLGLHIARGIVQAQAGRIWVESVPDAGSTFYFTVPRDAPTSEARSFLVNQERC